MTTILTTVITTTTITMITTSAAPGSPVEAFSRSPREGHAQSSQPPALKLKVFPPASRIHLSYEEFTGLAETRLAQNIYNHL